MGWIPDLPDPRDLTFGCEPVLSWLNSLERFPGKKLPRQVDLRTDDEGEYFFSRPHDQGPLNCSSAFAALGLLEYFERRIRGRTFDASTLFLYQVTSKRLQTWLRARGDAGADLRTTLKVLVQFGVPPEEYWPYEPDKFSDQPSPFLYGLAKPLTGSRFFRLDRLHHRQSQGSKLWQTLKSFLAAGFPVAFGFSVPTSLNLNANIPSRSDLDSYRGGQAAVAVGYEKDHFGKGMAAIRIRSSWGRQWGDNGNGWLPVSFIRDQLARDFWTMIHEDWLDSEDLYRPSVLDQFEKND